MTVNAWDPTATAATTAIEPKILEEFIRLSREDRLDNLAAELPPELQQQQALMRLSREAWNSAAEQLQTDDIVQLVRFFTVAEMQLDGWQAGEESPVIWLVKVLRKRKAPPSKELLLWIKANTDNRFLPNGPL